MAKLVETNAYVMINAVDLSDHVKSVKFNYNADLLESSAMGDTGKKRLAGLTDGTLEVEFYQDYASAKVDATLFPLVAAAPFACKVRAVNGAITATNPEYQFNALLGAYPGVSAQHGQIAMASVTFQVDGAVTRAVA